MKYRKKPIEIEAFRFGHEEWPQWFYDEGYAIMSDLDYKITIRTLEGNMIAKKGDWIIRGIVGEIYPCKHDIFIATYEAVE